MRNIINLSGLLALILLAAVQTDAALQDVQTVFVIVLENHDWSEIKGSSSAPFINDTLLPLASHAEQYFNPPHLHPSLPNYLYLEAGSNFGIHHNASPHGKQLTAPHLVALLDQAGISWTSYHEGICGCNCPLQTVKNYTPLTNPMVYFTDVTETNDVDSAHCIAHMRPLGELVGNLQSNTVARYNFITPSLCHAMHTPCGPLNDRIKQGDDWLQEVVPPILNSQAYQDNGALFITWDEGVPGDGPIGMIVLSPLAKGNGYSNTIHYTHSSTLRTLQTIFGVTPLLGDAAVATDLGDLFNP
ncbi:MAG: alkaline phosphatase family protein [Verrucomicrobiia bacterium]|jgi:phospholipase C